MRRGTRRQDGVGGSMFCFYINTFASVVANCLISMISSVSSVGFNLYVVRLVIISVFGGFLIGYY